MNKTRIYLHSMRVALSTKKQMYFLIWALVLMVAQYLPTQLPPGGKLAQVGPTPGPSHLELASKRIVEGENVSPNPSEEPVIIETYPIG